MAVWVVLSPCNNRTHTRAWRLSSQIILLLLPSLPSPSPHLCPHHNHYHSQLQWGPGQSCRESWGWGWLGICTPGSWGMAKWRMCCPGLRIPQCIHLLTYPWLRFREHPGVEGESLQSHPLLWIGAVGLCEGRLASLPHAEAPHFHLALGPANSVACPAWNIRVPYFSFYHIFFLIILGLYLNCWVSLES